MSTTNKFTIGSQNVNPKSASETTVLDKEYAFVPRFSISEQQKHSINGFEVQEFTPTCYA